MFQHHVGFSRYVTYVAVLLLAACATKSQQIAPQATGGLTDVRAQAVALKQQLSRTTDAARKVSQSSATDLKNSRDPLEQSQQLELDPCAGELQGGRGTTRGAQILRPVGSRNKQYAK